MGSDDIAFRALDKGMGEAVAQRTFLRKDANGKWENWGDVAKRVALGNSLLEPDKAKQNKERLLLQKHIANGSILLSGRHLQHGDATQPERQLEVFSNCSSSSTSFLSLKLLLEGSGVGRCFDDDMMIVDWDNAPVIRCVIDENHPDYDYHAHESKREALHKYGAGSRTVKWHEVGDSREGWAKALEIWEVMAFEKIHKGHTLILDFSGVRPKGSPIKGMQGRPSSGPVSLMNAFFKASTIVGAGMEPWRQAMYIDHFFSECVLVGGSRRSARACLKYWKDESILDFIKVKRPIEYANATFDEVIEYRKTNQPTGFLWSANNSIGVDAEFWERLNYSRKDKKYNEPLSKWARKVFRLATESAYADGTGEPGFINVDKLSLDTTGLDENCKGGDFVGSKKYQVEDDTKLYLSKLYNRFRKKKYGVVPNPCVSGETLVTTSIGQIPIKDLSDMKTDVPQIATYNTETGEFEWADISSVGKTRVDATVIQIELGDGKILILTPDHLVYTKNRSWVKASNLTTEDILIVM